MQEIVCTYKIIVVIFIKQTKEYYEIINKRNTKQVTKII